MIELRGLEVQAGGFRVGPVDLVVADGRYVVLLGPSGAGKSLVLEVVAGVRAAAGARSGWAAPTHRAHARPAPGGAGVPGRPAVPAPRRGGHIAYGMRAAGDGAAHAPGGRASRDAEVARLAETVGVTDLLARRPATLSGGERQRVALARALAASPRARCSTSRSARSTRRRARRCRKCCAASAARPGACRCCTSAYC